jgi:uncharacterized repeat protein (TIGR03803 family)
MPTLVSVRKSRTCHFCKAVAVILLLSCTAAPAAFAQTFTLLYSFTGGTDGGNPSDGLVLDSAGNLYGTTGYGGTGNCTQNGLSGCGTVFKVTNQGTETVLYSFQGSPDGEYPWSGVVLDGRGDLFGTTVNGGLGFGILFALDKSGTEHILHRFTGKTDGANPAPSLTFDRAGNLYGTTDAGGDLSCSIRGEGCGTLFKLSSKGGVTIHRFAGAPSDGRGPGYGAVLIDDAGNLYGTTGEGGTADDGTIYKVDQNGKYSVLYSFSGGSDGCEPLGNLAIDENGNLYGTASACGDYDGGTIFRVNSNGSLFVLYSFGVDGPQGGNAPFGGVTRDRTGNLYGTTLFGGGCDLVLGGCGTVFKFNSNGTMTILHSFEGYPDGASPWDNVILDAAGNVYGTTSTLGSGNAGTVWKIAP